MDRLGKQAEKDEIVAALTQLEMDRSINDSLDTNIGQAADAYTHDTGTTDSPVSTQNNATVASATN